MKPYAFGVDVGGTTVKIGLFSIAGGLLEKWEIPTRTEENGKNVLPDIARSVLDKADEKNISRDEIEGIGVGVPGPVDEKGTVLRCVNLGWDVFNVEDALSALVGGLKVKAGNDANVAALGEMWQGGGKGYKDLVMATLGTGVGGGIILDGHILAGSNGAAGEIGHMPMNDDETEFCGCGKQGCLEQYASATGIVRMTRNYLNENPGVETVLTKDSSAKDIFDAAKANDKVALQMVSALGKMLGKALASISCVVNPQVFVIGGGVSRAGEILIEAIRKEYVHYAFHASTNTPFKLAELGNDAGMYGCIKMVLE